MKIIYLLKDWKSLGVVIKKSSAHPYLSISPTDGVVNLPDRRLRLRHRAGQLTPDCVMPKIMYSSILQYSNKCENNNLKTISVYSVNK